MPSTSRIKQLEAELLQAKAALSRQQSDDELALNKIISAMPGNIFWKSKDGRFLGINNNLAKILGLASPDEIIGKRNEDVIAPQYAAELTKIDQKSMESTEGGSYEESGIDANGNHAIYFTQKIPIKNSNDEVIGLAGISMDITERKRIENELKIAKERAEASDIAKSQFLAVINHELRTPLTGIVGIVEILKQQLLDPEQTTHLIDDLDNCAQYLLALVNDVLDFTTHETNKTEVDITPTNIDQLVYEACSILTQLAQKKGLSIHYAIEKSTPIILTNPRFISQILINLINNAIKFTEKGSIIVRVAHKIIAGGQIELKMHVADTGQGIPTDKTDIIFEPFKQLQNTYIRESSRAGTGLGLAIVKRLTQLLNCSIHVDSSVGKGSIFTIQGNFNAIIPNENTPVEINETREKENNTPLSNSKKRNVLLVEDDKIVQMVHKYMLTNLDCDVDIASCGLDALNLKNPYDIAFVDIGLSDITGFELIKLMRQWQKETKNAFPIIALTGYTGEQEKLSCIEAGASEVIIKPASIEKLKDIIKKYL